MKEQMKGDKKLRLIGIPVLTLCLCVFFNLFFYLELGYPLWMVVVSNFCYVLFSFEFTRWIVLQTRERYPGFSKTWQRIILTVVSLLLAAFFLGAAHIHLEKDLLFADPTPKTIYNYLSAGGSTLFFTLIIASVYEAIYFLQQWHNIKEEKEVLEKANLHTQFELLKNQVQPHFLFNSLNTLISLVDEDPDRAKKFIKQLSFVYRYLLLSNKRTLIPLAEELKFIRAYFFLLQTRFEEGLLLHVAVDPTLESFLIPPLTLQILVENAVKHNLASKQQPLEISFFTDQQKKLTVKNKLRQKQALLPSSKMGLANISAKYRFLQQPDIQIVKTENEFMVSFFLINPTFKSPIYA